MSAYMRFRPKARILGSLLVYFNERVLVCAEARREALIRLKERSHG
jgi:hypothetical protein